MKAKFSGKYWNSIQEGSGPTWRAKESLALRGLSISSTLAAHYQERGVKICAFRTSSPLPGPNYEKKYFGTDIETFWKRMVDEPDAFPPEFWKLFLQSNLTAMGGN